VETGYKGPPFDPERVVEVKTEAGTLLAEKSSETLTASLLEHHAWDPSITGLIRTALEPGMTFVDAGANIGYFSVLASGIVGPGGRVFAIEADPANQAILAANLERNGCSNATILPYAAWNEHAELDLARPDNDGAVARVSYSEGATGKVEAAPIDDLIAGPVDYLKVDCEQTDHRVVAGARRLLAENPSLLVTVEFHPWRASHTGESPAQVLDTYRGLGLTPYEIDTFGKLLEETTWERIAEPTLLEGRLAFDFAMCKELPPQIPTGTVMPHRGLLEKAGDLLEHVPAAIRPPIRDRDREARRKRKAAGR
jgi:FkbM family methyltransferase